ncbi:hypothetical protein K438DRAFT_1981387 [Mycena galopus ATCC 62051]|nr:hypothetical protein K438DRAFT_1981387 [Mycena galopus ATCC 62051]
MGENVSTIYASNWQQACAARFNCTSDGLLNMNAQPISCPANSTIQATPEIWGITYEACQAQCGMDVLVQSVDFYSAAIPLTTWLLPWIALIAQLPFEAEGWMDLLSACLCVGSPVLATYSLALTALNRGYIAAEFQRLAETAKENTNKDYRYLDKRISEAEFILQESQQCPMRANQRNGELAGLIVLPDRENFWESAAKDLKNTRRDFTYSFLAQVVLAFVTYLISFTAVRAVHDSLGSPDVGLQFASSSVWSWMFPIVFGYIRVGSQYKAGAIKAALTSNPIISQREESVGVEILYQKGLRPNANLYAPSPKSDSAVPPTGSDHPEINNSPDIPLASTSYLTVPTVAGGQDLSSSRPTPPESTITLVPPANGIADAAAAELDHVVYPSTGMDVGGDERGEDPIFNYARTLTWFAIPVTAATVEDAAAGCHVQLHADLPAFKFWSQITSKAIHHMFYAALLALFLQWNTTGAAMFVAYRTPAIGLGYRSGSYLIYGVASTIAWLLLRLEQDLERKEGVGFLGGVAVLSRVTAKAIAIANAMWLIASSVLEDIGTFQTCWCQTCAFQFHKSGWTPVFKGASDLRNAANGVWVGGFLC